MGSLWTMEDVDTYLNHNSFCPVSIYCTQIYLELTAVMQVKADIIAESPVGQAARLVKIYVEAFKSDVIVFICNIIMYLMSH